MASFYICNRVTPGFFFSNRLLNLRTGFFFPGGGNVTTSYMLYIIMYVFMYIFTGKYPYGVITLCEEGVILLGGSIQTSP